VLLAAVVILPGYDSCGKPFPETLSVKITRQPAGGMNVGLVSCAYTVSYIKGQIEDEKKYRAPEGIDLKVYIKNDRGSTYSEQNFSFDEKNSSASKVISFQAPAGMYLDKTFWAVFEWSDDTGSHTLESSKAVCTVR
jgi:hypothetical protein